MTQNIYDDPHFLAGYQNLPRSIEGLSGAPEWPALRALLPDLADAAVVDLGCGFGWFCRWAAATGARSVVGLDVSIKMLERAAADTDDDVIEYRRADLEHIELAPVSFDCVYSSLTLHYIADLPRLLRVVHGALNQGGRLVFSVEHPVFTAPARPEFVEVDKQTVWPLDGYLVEGERTTNWFTEGVIKRHRTIGRYVNTLIDLGFTITRLEEWGPTDEQVAAHPEWTNERDRPPFLLVACQKTLWSKGGSPVSEHLTDSGPGYSESRVAFSGPGWPVGGFLGAGLPRLTRTHGGLRWSG